MIFFFILGILSCFTLFTFYAYLDLRVIFRTIFIVLSLEFIASLLANNNISLTGASYLYYLGELFTNNMNTGIELFLIIDGLTTTFHLILFVALGSCFIFLITYFTYDFNNLTIIALSSIFSQLAFFFFTSGDLFSLIFF